MEALIFVAVFAAGVVAGFTIAAVTETRVERKLDKKFWAMKHDLEAGCLSAERP